MIAERILLGLLVGAVATGCILILYPFFSAILWAAILVFSSWPLYEQCRIRGLGRIGAACAMVLLAALLLVMPLAVAAPSSVDDVAHLRHALHGLLQTGIPAAPQWLSDMPVLGPALARLWNAWAADLSAMAAFFRPYFGAIAEAGLSALLVIANGLLGIVLALFVAFFFYIHGELLAARLCMILRRIGGEQADRVILITGQTIRGTVYGIIGTALVQGLLTFLGLWLADVPRAPLLALVAGFISVLPVGAPVIWIPAGLWLMASGHMAKGVFLLLYGAIFITGADHLIRPYFIARGAQLPFLLTVLGVLGGALAFGLPGIFVGPVLLGIGYTLANEFALASGRKPESTSIGRLDL